MATEEPEAAAPRLNIIQSTVRVLKLLADAPQPLGVNAVARLLDLAPSTCFKILKVLVADDLVDFDGRSKEYSLGSGAIRLARRALDPASAYSMVRSRFENFAIDHDVSIGLWQIVTNRRMVLVGFAEGRSTMRIHMAVGQRVPALVGALGRAIAAKLHLSRDELAAEFEHLRWQRPISLETYLDQVDEAARNGYGVDEGAFSFGVRTVAVTVSEASGNVRYGITAAMFREGRDVGSIDQLATDLLGLGHWVEERLTNAQGSRIERPGPRAVAG